MLSSSLNNRIGNVMATIAVSQILVERLKSLLRVNKFDVSSIGITSSLSLTINLAQMVGMSYDEIVEMITNFLTEKNGESIKSIDKIVRTAMLAALDAMVSCANSPIIGDELLYMSSGDTYEAAESPIKVNLSTVDMFNLFSRSTPTGEFADYYYGDVPSGITPGMTWMSGDLNAFIWYILNMVEPFSEKDITKLEKQVWDNRNTEFKDYLFDEDLSQYTEGEMVTYDGEDALDFWGLEDSGDTPNTLAHRKKIAKIDYDDRTNSLIIQFPEETYGKKKIFGFELGDLDGDGSGRTFTYERNRTIYDFNKDYVDNLRIFYVKPIVAAVVDAALNNSITFSLSKTLSFEEELIKGQINGILEKVIEADDTEIEDCYFSFSNDEYDRMIYESELRKRGVNVIKGDTNVGMVQDPDDAFRLLDEMTGTATLHEQKTIIKNTFTSISSSGGNSEDILNTKYNWNGDSYATNILNLLKSIMFKMLEAFLTPKVILIFLINFKFANGELPKTPLDFMSAFLKMLFPVIKEPVDFFINYLFDEVLKRLKELMEVYLLKLSLEQLEKYKAVVLALIENCTLNLFVPYMKKTQLVGNIDNVVGADIVGMEEQKNNDNC